MSTSEHQELHEGQYRLLWIGGLIVGFLVLDGFLSGIFDLNPSDSYFEAMLIGATVGVFIGQLNLVSFWAVASTAANLVTRIPWCFLSVTLMWSTAVLGDRWLHPATPCYDTELSSNLLSSMIIGCGVALIPAFVVMRMWDWRFVRLGRVERKSRFSMKDLLLATLILATAFAIFRAAVHLCEFDLVLFSKSFGQEELTYVVIPSASVVNVLLITPCLFLSRRFLGFPQIVWLTLTVAAISVIETAVVGSILTIPMYDWPDVMMLFFGGNMGQVISFIATLKLLQSQVGFRWTTADALADVEEEVVEIQDDEFA